MTFLDIAMTVFIAVVAIVGVAWIVYESRK